MPDIFSSKKEKEEKLDSPPVTLRTQNPVSTKKIQKKKHSAVPTTKQRKKISRERKKKIKASLAGLSKHDLPAHSHNSLSAFSYYPKGVNFVNEDPEEEIILLLRKHPVTNIKWISIALAMILAPAFFTVMPIYELLPIRFQIITVVVWYMITIAYIFEEFLSWFFHVNIVTDERIVEVDFHNLIYRELSEANLDQIQDVTVQVGGAFQTSLNYGNVQIQTAAEIPEIEFESVPNPDVIAKVLRDLRVEEEIEKIEGRVR